MGTKISALPAASTPLSGAELAPIVQNGVTRRVPVSAFSSVVSGAFTLTGVGAAAVAAGQTDNWTPTLTNISRIRVTAAGSAVITGLVGGTDGRVIVITNVGANDVELRAQSASSVAANRFASNGDTLLPSGCSAMFVYDGSLARWTRMGF